MKQLILFTAHWCDHCQALKSTLEVVRQQGISIQEVNVDEEPNRAMDAKVMNIPTVVLAENEQEVRRFVGAKSFNDIMKFYHEG
jgi:thioredoxin 1